MHGRQGDWRQKKLVDDQAEFKKISEDELEGLQYLAGYVILKLRKKHNENRNTI